jgi:DnaK suppressor protein
MDDADRAEAHEQFFRDAAIRAARKQLDADEIGSGVCRDCGWPIPVERLQARPFAARCTDCQHDHELRIKGGVR